MKKVGFVGWRGMVGSVLMDRMRSEGDFEDITPVFFSTSQAGGAAPDVGKDGVPALQDAHDLDRLSELDVIVTAQGGDYTSRVHPELRARGFGGYWVDAASSLRMEDSALIVLDPVNRQVIERGLDAGIKDYVGGNCTVSLMLMAFAGLFEQGLVQWVSSMTYQAASGAGARQMRELLQQMRALGAASGAALDDPGIAVLELDRRVTEALRSDCLPTEALGHPLAASLLPWIDRAVDNGATREEWKGHVEANKILASDPEIPVDGTCVRVGSMRCHAQAVLIKLRQDVPLADIEQAIAGASDWSSVVPNEKQATLDQLTPAAIAGTLSVPVGRLRKARMGPEYLNAFTVGDQLLWGAAEPLRRMLRILRET